MNEAGSENLADDADPKASPDAAEQGADRAGPEQTAGGPAAEVTPPEKPSPPPESPKGESPPSQPTGAEDAEGPSDAAEGPAAETPAQGEAVAEPPPDEEVSAAAPAGAPAAEPVAETRTEEGEQPGQEVPEPSESAAATASSVAQSREEEKPAAEDEAAPSAEKAEEEAKEEVDLEAVAQDLDEKRGQLVTELFGEYRPRAAAIQKVIEGFTDTLQALVAAAGAECADEATKLAQAGRQRHEEALAIEKSRLQKHSERVVECAECYEGLFKELDALVEQVGKELEPLDLESEQYQSAPGGLQDRLANYRKGVEIIHRMLSRVKDRKKELAQELPALANGGLEPAEPPVEVPELDAYFRQLSTKFHDLRDANENTLRDAEDVGAKCWKAAVHVVKGVISAVDGIDSGLENEPDTRADLKQYEGEEQRFAELIDSWFQAYHRLQQRVEAFFAKTGIEAHAVEPGTPFDPDTMEPQGTVESSQYQPGTVAVVARRGFSLKGELVRPMIVEVVKVE